MDFIQRSLLIIGGILLAGLILAVILSGGFRHFFKGLGRFLATLLVTIVCIAVILALAVNMIVRGPSVEAKNLFVTTLLETGKLKWVVGLFMSSDEINKVIAQTSMGVIEADTDPDLIDINEELDMTQITIDTIEGDNFTAIMMVVNDPSRVFVGTTYPWSTYGKELDKIVKAYDAVGGVNGGLYYSKNNEGGRPYGPTVSQGKIQHMSELGLAGLTLIGMSEDNILKVIDISGKGEAAVRKIIEEEQIRDAVCFQDEASDKNNHFVKLIINGEKRELNGMGSGANPRTAIGQTADGRMLLLVTDGRGANGHLGATASDLIDIMESYGAVNAANLDGGSSTCMYYNGEWLRNSVTLYYESSSWRIPTSFLVK